MVLGVGVRPNRVPFPLPRQGSDDVIRDSSCLVIPTFYISPWYYCGTVRLFSLWKTTLIARYTAHADTSVADADESIPRLEGCIKRTIRRRTVALTTSGHVVRRKSSGIPPSSIYPYEGSGR